MKNLAQGRKSEPFSEMRCELISKTAMVFLVSLCRTVVSAGKRTQKRAMPARRGHSIELWSRLLAIRSWIWAMWWRIEMVTSLRTLGHHWRHKQGSSLIKGLWLSTFCFIRTVFFPSAQNSILKVVSRSYQMLNLSAIWSWPLYPSQI